MLVGAPSVALAGVTMTGADYEINYGSCGTWYDAGGGILVEDPQYGFWPDFTDATNPWTQITLEYDQGSTTHRYEANDGDGTCDFTVLGVRRQLGHCGSCLHGRCLGCGQV